MPTQDTKKERREIARKARIEAQRARERKRKRKKQAIIASVLVVAVGLGYFIWQRAQESDKLVNAAADKAGCGKTEAIKKLEASPHLESGAPDPEYNSNPPTSGLHLPSTAPWGAQDESIDKKLLVHNLEHGGIVLHYKDLPDGDVDKLNDLADGYADGVVAVPNPDIDKPIAMAAWGKLRECEKLSIPVVETFIAENCNKGPEKLGLRCG